MRKGHLRDLYVKGRVHKMIDEVNDVEAELFLKKLNTSENEQALRAANAARAVLLAAAADPTSDIYLATLGEAMDEDRDRLIDYLISEEVAKLRDSAEAEIGDKEEWSDDDYLQGLSDAWRNGLEDKWKADPEDPDAKRVFEALKKFAAEVSVRMEGELAHLRRNWEDVPDQELREKATTHLLKIRSDISWVEEFRKAELMIGCRLVEDHQKKYFDYRYELDDLETDVIIGLLRAYRELTTEPTEGKELQETPNS